MFHPAANATSYLQHLVTQLKDARERTELEKECQKIYFDAHHRPAPDYASGTLVLLESHALSNASKGFSSKLAPKRDGPYRILRERSPTSYEMASLDNLDESIGKYHVSELTPFVGSIDSTQPIQPKPRKGRPRKQMLVHSRVRQSPRVHQRGSV